MEPKEFRVRNQDKAFVTAFWLVGIVLCAAAIFILVFTDRQWFASTGVTHVAVLFVAWLAAILAGLVLDGFYSLRRVWAKFTLRRDGIVYETWGSRFEYPYSEILCGRFRALPSSFAYLILGKDHIFDWDELTRLCDCDMFATCLIAQADTVLVDERAEMLLEAARRHGWRFRKKVDVIQWCIAGGFFLGLWLGFGANVLPFVGVCIGMFFAGTMGAFPFESVRVLLSSTRIARRSLLGKRELSLASIDRIVCEPRGIGGPFVYKLYSGKSKVVISTAGNAMLALNMALARMYVDLNGHALRMHTRNVYLNSMIGAASIFPGLLTIALFSTTTLPAKVVLALSATVAVAAGLCAKKMFRTKSLILGPSALEWIPGPRSVEIDPGQIVGADPHKEKNKLRIAWQDVTQRGTMGTNNIDIPCDELGVHWSVLFESLKRTYPNAKWNFEPITELRVQDVSKNAVELKQS